MSGQEREVNALCFNVLWNYIIRMFHNEHNPPHFHADYQGQRGIFDFDGKMIKGNITSKTAKKLIEEWAQLHQQDLSENWVRASQKKQIDRIAPLN